jgi:cob(I)alamin adenosyltransferase
MHIYTRTGDNGSTGVIGGRLSKTSQIFDLVGSLDELNSAIGVVISLLNGQEQLSTDTLDEISILQPYIFELGTLVVSVKGKIKKRAWEERTAEIEKIINRYEEELPTLKNFILPGGAYPAAYLHLARSICRRAEREGFKYLKEISGSGDEKANTEYVQELSKALKFLNRTSDLYLLLQEYYTSQMVMQIKIWKG